MDFLMCEEITEVVSKSGVIKREKVLQYAITNKSTLGILYDDFISILPGETKTFGNSVYPQNISKQIRFSEQETTPSATITFQILKIN